MPILIIKLQTYLNLFTKDKKLTKIIEIEEQDIEKKKQLTNKVK